MEETLNKLIECIDSIPSLAVIAIIFLLAVLQYIFPPVPSDTVLIAIGIIANSDFTMGFEMFFSYIAGAIVGSSALYEICRVFGDNVRNIKFIRNMIEEEKLEKACANLEKYGGFSFFFLRFIPAMSIITIIAFGLIKIKRRKVYSILIIVGITGSLVFSLIGFLLGENLRLIDTMLKKLGVFGWIIFGVIILIVVILQIINKIKPRS